MVYTLRFGIYIKIGRRGGIRTPDGLLPKQVHYQAVLRAEMVYKYTGYTVHHSITIT